MSRIVRGPSPEIRGMHSAKPVDKAARSLNATAFHTMRMEGLYSEEEIIPRIQAAKLEGFKDAEGRAMAQVRSALQNIESLVDEISKFRRELFKECDKDVLDLVQVICKKILQKELSLKPELLLDIVQKSLGTLEKEKRVVLQMNGQDLDLFKRAKADFLEQFKGVEDLTYEVDARIPPGHLIARTQKIELDINTGAMVDHLLAQVKATKTEIGSGNDEGEMI